VTEQPPSYPPPPPGGESYPSPPGGQSYPPPPPGGYGPPPVSGYAPPQSAGTNGFAIASLVSSLFGWLCLVGPFLGFIFGFVALGQIKRTGQGGRGLAIAGIIIGAVIVAFVIAFWIIAAIIPTPQKDSGAPPVVVISVDHQAVSRGVTV
jgi:hypothetical protein